MTDHLGGLGRLLDRVDAVAFDCDGVLADTDDAWELAEAELCRRYGVDFTPELRVQTQGQPMEASVRLLVGDSTSRPAHLIVDELIDLAAASHADGVLPLPGAVELLSHLADLMPVAVVSNTPRCILDVVLSGIGVTDRLHCSIAGDEVRPKPHPEPYLCAAAALGVAPNRMLVLEDSVPGGQAALAAGAVLVEVAAPGRPSLPGASVRIGGLHEVLPHPAADERKPTR